MTQISPNNTVEPLEPSPSAKPKKVRKSRSRRKPLTPNPDHVNKNNDGEIIDGDEAKPRTKRRRISGTISASMLPSYCLKRSLGSFLKYRGETIRSKHKKRLWVLLKNLIRRHNWVEASGVLSVLLKATTREKSSRHNRLKYWAALEILKQIKGDNISSRRILNVYELWMKKSGSNNSKNGAMKSLRVKERFAIQLEYIIFCLTRGDLEDAHQAALGLMQERGFESDALANFVVGLSFYELWYSGLPKEWQLMDMNNTTGSMQSESHKSGGISDEYDAIESQESGYSVKVGSVTSVAKEKDNMVVDSDEDREVPLTADDNLQTQSPQRSLYHDNTYVYSAEGSENERSSSPASGGDLPYVSIFHAPGLPPWLLPLKLPSTNENLEDVLYTHRDFKNHHFESALKHLRVALHSTPPVAEALHPLIQLLLIGDQVSEALDELDTFQGPAIILKSRLKAALLEHFDRSNYLRLSSSYEDILEVDPTCSHSLTKLVNMHQRGDYNMVELVNMIALHLDATYAESNIWKEFASCLMKLSMSAGDQMSMCLNGAGEESQQTCSGHVNQIPELFTIGESGKAWRLRCRWWLTRHFSPNILVSEIAAGDLKLLTYKAAAAAFLYGRGFEYVTRVTEILERENKWDIRSILKMHVQNCVGIYMHPRP